MTNRRRAVTLALALAIPAAVAACASVRTDPAPAAAPRVGPPRGTVIVVGGGSMGPEIYQAFIDAAGGPDALIIDVPTAGGAAAYPQDAPGARGWRQAGARNVVVLHTTDRRLADSDSFASLIGRAGGVWFEGGRHYRLVDSYAGTRSERAFHDVLARGGVVGGSSAGASILADFLVRGAPSNDNLIMDHPSYRKGFAFLRGTAIDQHVVARERLADLADSIMPRYPHLLGLSEDEGTAWVIRGDTGVIVGRSKAFVYGGRETDPRRPFLTLLPGDRYDLGARRLVRRAGAGSPLSESFVDGLLRRYDDPALGGATVLVARGGAVLVNRSYGIADRPKLTPATTLPTVPLGGISAVFAALCAQLPAPLPRAVNPGASNAPETPLQACVARRVAPAVGAARTRADSAGEVRSSVDELYRIALGLEHPRTFTRDTTSAAGGSARTLDVAAGWTPEPRGGSARLAAYATPDGRRGAFLRAPAERATVIVLTSDASFDARAAAHAIMDRLLAAK